MMKQTNFGSGGEHNSSPSQVNKREVYITRYGDTHTGFTITSHPHIEETNDCNTVTSIPTSMSDTEREKERVKKVIRRIKDAAYPNHFQIFVLLTWKSSKMRWDTKAQDKDVSSFFNKLHKQYPELVILAVRHKCPKGTGYHVHVIIGNLPRRKLRIIKGEFDEHGRQLYYLLGWGNKGRATAEYIESELAVKNYLANREKIKLIPRNVKCIVYRTRNLIRTKRESCGMNDEEITTILKEKKSNKEIRYTSKFDVAYGDGLKEKMTYVFTDGEFPSPISEKGGEQE